MFHQRAKTIITLFIFMIVIPLLALHIARLLCFGETFFPETIEDCLNNPYLGWAPSAEGGPYEQPHRLVYVNVTWRELEPAAGQYAFTELEQKYKFAYWQAQGVKIIFRVNMDFPGNTLHLDIPDWLYDEIGGDGTWYELDYGRGFSPNYSNPYLIARHQCLLDALGIRYNKDPLVPIVVLGSIGHWGEWHTKQDQEKPLPFPPIEVSDQYAAHYLRAFPDKFLLMRRPFAIAKENGLGLYNDSFGNREQTYQHYLKGINEGYHDYLAGIPQPAMPSCWQTAFSGGEVANPPGMDCFTEKSIAATIQEIRDCHLSWLGPSSPAYLPGNDARQEYANRALSALGYRFHVHSLQHPPHVKAGGSLPLKIVWENSGAAPFYYPWPVELSLAGPDGSIFYKTELSEDIRNWLPGKTTIRLNIPIPSDLPAGRYRLCAAILDPATGQPAIELAMRGKRPDGRYALDTVTATGANRTN